MRGYLPLAWKKSVVIPIPKSGRPSRTLQDLQPISLASSLCKVMERRTLRKLKCCLDRYSVLSPMQVCFHRGLCAQDILSRLCNDILAYPSRAQL